LDELSLKRELSEFCHRIGVDDWQTLIKAIFDWIAEANGAGRMKRIAAVNELLREVRKPSRDIVAWATSNPEELLDESRNKIHKLLTSFIKNQQIRTNFC